MRKLTIVFLMSLACIQILRAEVTTTDSILVDTEATIANRCLMDNTVNPPMSKNTENSYINCIAQIDYKTVYATLNDKVKASLLERCSMLEIQNEMGVDGETAMSPTQIDAYEKMIGDKCKCIAEGKVFTRNGMSGTCSGINPKQRDLFTYTLDLCTKRLKNIDNTCASGTKASCAISKVETTAPGQSDSMGRVNGCNAGFTMPAKSYFFDCSCDDGSTCNISGALAHFNMAAPGNYDMTSKPVNGSNSASNNACYNPAQPPTVPLVVGTGTCAGGHTCNFRLGDWGETCKSDLRQQCYEYLKIPTSIQEPLNPVLNKCDFDNQTITIAQNCRSYCYVHNTCPIGVEGTGTNHELGAIGNGAINPKFKARKISNMYLLKQYSSASCLKGSSFGILSNNAGKKTETGEIVTPDPANSIFADQSCYGKFAIQYKDPDCGYRPICPILAADGNGQSIPLTGTTIVPIRCDGTAEKNVGTSDLTAVYCEVKVPDVNAANIGEANSQSVAPDISKVVTGINSIEFVNKFGPAKCSSGANGTVRDYEVKDFRAEAKGMGILVRNGCQGDFKVNVNWKKTDCTMAGETTDTDTCCQSLTWDAATRTCMAPDYDPDVLSDTSKVVLTGQNCQAKLGEDVKILVGNYMKELGAYDQLFTMLNDKADEYFKTIQLASSSTKADKLNSAKLPNTPEVSTLPAAPDSTYMIVKKAYEAFWKFKKSMTKSRKDYLDAIATTKAQLDEYATLIGPTDAGTLTNEQKEKLKKNIFAGESVQDAAAAKSIQILNQLEIAYTQSIADDIDKFQVEMDGVKRIGMNLAWLCAHKENCVKNNWLVKNASADNPVILDFLLDPIHSSKIEGPSGKLLATPGGIRKILVPTDKYNQFEKGIRDYDVLNKYLSYEDFTANDIPPLSDKETAALLLYRRFSTEFPLRKDSLMKDSSLATYLDQETNRTNKTPLMPYYCKEQNEGFEIRIPVGKALEPMRILQVSELIKEYFLRLNAGINGQKNCNNIELKKKITLNKGVKIGKGGGGSGGGGTETILGNTPISQNIANLLGITNETSFGVALANLSLPNGSAGISTSGVGTQRGSSSGGSGSGSSGAISFKDFKDKKNKAQKAAITKRQSSHNDKLIGKHAKSLSASFGGALKKRDIAAIGSGLFNSSGKGSSSLEDSSNNGSTPYGGNGSNSTNGLNFGQGASSGFGSRGGGAYGGSGGHGSRDGAAGSGAGSGNISAQAGSNGEQGNSSNVPGGSRGSEMYKTNENDSIFEIITKAYIRNYDRIDTKGTRNNSDK